VQQRHFATAADRAAHRFELVRAQPGDHGRAIVEARTGGELDQQLTLRVRGVGGQRSQDRGRAAAGLRLAHGERGDDGEGKRRNSLALAHVWLLHTVEFGPRLRQRPIAWSGPGAAGRNLGKRRNPRIMQRSKTAAFPTDGRKYGASGETIQFEIT
jgi:hypothetical protein